MPRLFWVIAQSSGTKSRVLSEHNPEAFLREVLTRIAEHPVTRISELLPWHLQVTHATPLTGNGATPELPPQA